MVAAEQDMTIEMAKARADKRAERDPEGNLYALREIMGVDGRVRYEVIPVIYVSRGRGKGVSRETPAEEGAA